MSPRSWSFLLSWSRVGINAALFLIAARVLTLAEIGLFATAFAPIKLLQGLQKSGASDAVVLFAGKTRRWEALFALSLALGALGTALFATLGALFSPMLVALSALPLLHGIGAVPEGILRHRLATKALALRTLAVQLIALALALWMLRQGYGPWALVGFALANAALSNLACVILARWRPRALPRRGEFLRIWPKTVQIGARVLLGTAQMPLAQLAIGLVLGPAAAGAFQIATRMLELVEALTLSPLRYIALPQLRQSRDPDAMLLAQTRQAALLAVAAWGVLLLATEPILALAVGATHAPAAAPVLQALAPLGLISALAMPLTQALTASGRTGLTLARAALTLSLGALLMGPALTLSLSPTTCALALSLAGALSTAWLVTKALPRWSIA